MEQNNIINEIDSDIEPIDEITELSAPFDPKDIKVTAQAYTLGQVIDRLEHNEIKLDTEYQRLPGLWDIKRKSQFIESVLLRLPIPMFYFDAQDDNKWRIIDGLQRIYTLKEFVLDKKLRLEGLEFLKEFNTKFYTDLPRDLQRRISTFPINIYILEAGTPDVVKFNIFSRLNKSGMVLQPQEIRHALHQGIGADFVKALVSPETPEGMAFINTTEGKIKTDRMQDRDFATRFISFYLISYTEYQPDLDSFMNKGMGKLKYLSPTELQQLKDDFREAMNIALEIFGDDAFRKRFDWKEPRKPINKALFEVLSVCLAKLSESERSRLVENKAFFKENLRVEMINENKKLFRAITQGTALKDTVTTRFEIIQDIIKNLSKSKVEIAIQYLNAL
jgi:Protein of unknown function DUF262